MEEVGSVVRGRITCGDGYGIGKGTMKETGIPRNSANPIKQKRIAAEHPRGDSPGNSTIARKGL